MKAIEQYFHVVLFIMMYKVGLTFMSVDEALVCHQMKAIEQFFHGVLFIMLYKTVPTFTFADETSVISFLFYGTVNFAEVTRLV